MAQAHQLFWSLLGDGRLMICSTRYVNMLICLQGEKHKVNLLCLMSVEYLTLDIKWFKKVIPNLIWHFNTLTIEFKHNSWEVEAPADWPTCKIKEPKSFYHASYKLLYLETRLMSKGTRKQCLTWAPLWALGEAPSTGYLLGVSLCWGAPRLAGATRTKLASYHFPH